MTQRPCKTSSPSLSYAAAVVATLLSCCQRWQGFRRSALGCTECLAAAFPTFMTCISKTSALYGILPPREIICQVPQYLNEHGDSHDRNRRYAMRLENMQLSLFLTTRSYKRIPRFENSCPHAKCACGVKTAKDLTRLIRASPSTLQTEGGAGSTRGGSRQWEESSGT